MKKARWISAAIGTAVLTAGFVLPASAAFADGPSGNGNAGVLSLLSGNNVNAPVSAPVDICGVAVALLGGANAGCEGGAASNTIIGDDATGGSDNGNAGSISALSGNNVSIPVSVCGVAAAVAGGANSGCKGGAASNTVIQGATGGSNNGNAGGAAIGSGNNVNAPVSAPVSVC